MGLILYIIFHLICMAAAIILATIMENLYVIDDKELSCVLSAILPWGVIVWLLALYAGEKISENLA